MLGGVDLRNAPHVPLRKKRICCAMADAREPSCPYCCCQRQHDRQGRGALTEVRSGAQCLDWQYCYGHVDLNRCTTVDGRPDSATQGGPIINAFRVTAQNGVYFSNAHQTVDSSGYPVTDYIRHSLSREGKLTVRASKLVAGPANKIMNQGEFVRELRDGANFA
ncbi:VirK family protein [Bradyrhizobium sp. 162]|uniref:VirK family protein n=1 Tax=Bradyrhizobium sp. 162 TaxID=2782635 RepID=UPI003208E484